MFDAAVVFFQKAFKISHISVTQFETKLDVQMPFFDNHLFLFSRTQTADIKHATSLHTVCFWVIKGTNMQSSANVSADSTLLLSADQFICTVEAQSLFKLYFGLSNLNNNGY